MKFTAAIAKVREQSRFKKGTDILLEINGLLQKITGTKYWITKHKFVWYLCYKTKGIHVVVPEDFVTDFGSIPRFMQPFLSSTKYVSYILHDYLVRNLTLTNDDGNKVKITRWRADIILCQALRVEGMNWFALFLIYGGVTIGTAFNYVKDYLICIWKRLF